MEELTMAVNWWAVVVGAIAAYGLGALWYSPKVFGVKWMDGVGLSANDKSSVKVAMITQAVGTFLLAWVIGITETTDSMLFALLITLTIAILIKAGGLYRKNSHYAIKTDAGFVVAMVVVMILAHVIL